MTLSYISWESFAKVLKRENYIYVSLEKTKETLM